MSGVWPQGPRSDISVRDRQTGYSTEMIKVGINSTDLGLVARVLGSALDVEFVAHESDYRGGNYYRAQAAEGTLLLQTNYDLIDDETFESARPERAVVLYLDGPQDSKWEASMSIIMELGDLKAVD